MNRLGRLALALMVLVGMAVFVSWPQAANLSTQVASHFDPYFSMWRLTWIAHALSNEPANLFNGNIFHPVPRTLAMSDATLMQGVIAAPMLWSDVSPVLVYNLLLYTGMVGSGLAMFFLARSLTGATGPALVAAVIFSVAPYRIEHFMHLELQWAMWIPLTFWAVHQAAERESWRFGVLVGVFLWLQMLAAVYYGVFLAMVLIAFVPIVLLAKAPDNPVRVLAGLAGGAVLAGALTLPYARTYQRNAVTLGDRDMTEIARYSAIPLSYLSSPQVNWLWGWTSEWASDELYLFPGAVAIVLALAAFLYTRRRLVVIYTLLFLVCFELSLGTNGIVYPFLLEHVGALNGLRSTSRFGVISLCAVGMLSAFGLHAIQQRFAAGSVGRGAIPVAAALGLMTFDYRNDSMYWVNVAPDAPESRNVYATLRTLGPGVVLELPQPELHALPGYDPWYEYWSRQHWYPLVNGYSGYYPHEYVETLVRMRNFPDDASLEHLRNLNVRYIIVHRRHYDPDSQFVSLVFEMSRRPELRRYGALRAPHGEVELFIVEN